jgi:hypothetical protein
MAPKVVANPPLDCDEAVQPPPLDPTALDPFDTEPFAVGAPVGVPNGKATCPGPTWRGAPAAASLPPPPFAVCVPPDDPPPLGGGQLP